MTTGIALESGERAATPDPGEPMDDMYVDADELEEHLSIDITTIMRDTLLGLLEQAG